VSATLMLLATALWAAAHAEHPTVTDLAIQAILVLFMSGASTSSSVVPTLRERHVIDAPEAGASPFVAEVEQRSARAAAQGTIPPAAPGQVPSEG
jgi:hypothetical protein